MARPIKSTKFQRFLKYMGLTAAMIGIMGFHFYTHPPEKFTKRGYRQIVEINHWIWEKPGINPHAFGEVKTDGPFTPPSEKK